MQGVQYASVHPLGFAYFDQEQESLDSTIIHYPELCYCVVSIVVVEAIMTSSFSNS